MNRKGLILLIKQSIQNTLVFKGSFFIKMITVFLSEISAIYVMMILLTRFQGIGNTNSGKFAFMFFFAHMSYSLCNLIFSNLRQLGRLIQMGTFDRIELLPVNTLCYVGLLDFDISCIGEVITSIILFILFKNSYGIKWNIGKIFFLGGMLVSSILILASIMIVLSSCAFKIIDWKPLDNMLGAFKEMMWYPLNIYNNAVKAILYTFIPLAYIVQVPTELMYSKSVLGYNSMMLLAPYLIASIVIFVCSCKIWHYQESKYQSVG